MCESYMYNILAKSQQLLPMLDIYYSFNLKNLY